MSDGSGTLSRRQRRSLAATSEDLTAVLATGEGRRVMRWVLDRSGLFLSADDPAFDSGRRELGLEIVTAMNSADPYEFVRLMKEGADDVIALRAKARRGQIDGDADDDA